MEVEQLKLLAERLGYFSVKIQTDGNEQVVSALNERHSIRTEFNPETNAGQLLEVIEWLLDGGWELTKPNYHLLRKKITPHNYNTALGKTLAEAVLKAAKDEDCEARFNAKN